MKTLPSLIPILAVALAVGSAGAVLAEADMQYRGEPRDLGYRAERLGELVADAGFTDLDGRQHHVSKLLGEKGLVVAVRDAECPLARKLGPKLARLEKEARAAGFGVLYVNPNAHDTLEAMRGDTARHGFSAPYAADREHAVAAALAAKTSTEVFVLDAARTLVYRGAVDDQLGLGFTKPAPMRHYLRDALAAVAEGRQPDVQATTAPGCALSLEPAPAAEPELTYHNRISRILQNRCQSCHRPGGAGPFALTHYAAVKSRRTMIEWVVEDRVMPPFYVDEGSYGPFANDLRLTADERADLLAWLDSGAPEGDPAEAPLPRQWVEGWTIDEPDYVVQVPEPFTVPAEGQVDYQYFYVRTDLPEDRWVRQIEVRSTAPGVVHHVLVFLESPEVLERLQDRRREVDDPWRDPEYRRLRARFQSGIDSYFAGTVPGQSGIVFPQGMGKKLPAGAWLKFQVHYTPNGEEVTDRTEIGFVFADAADSAQLTEVRTSSAYNRDFVIPAGKSDVEVQAEYTFEERARVLSLAPHTHLRGTRFLYEAIYPDGRSETILPLSRYDFNWQLNYRFLKPLELPAGTVVRATAWYDNSRRNPANPDPTVDVRFGDQTWDEMMIGYINWVPAETRRQGGIGRSQ